MQGRCILCGRRSQMLISNLCPTCFLKTHRLLEIPARLEVDYCKYCGAYRYGHRWLPGGEPGEAAINYMERWASDKPRPLVRLASYRVV